MSEYDHEINEVNSIYGSKREGDVLHSLASIEKASVFFEYYTKFSLNEGLKIAIDRYYNNLER
jgi:UDP-N-acetylglucosamine/UDP-N-acetylgalactosamine 4-epimerase